jgi:hypothetical protein
MEFAETDQLTVASASHSHGAGPARMLAPCHHETSCPQLLLNGCLSPRAEMTGYHFDAYKFSDP